MALPTSRDITLTPASPVPSALLDKLQDMHVGAKLISLEHMVSPDRYIREAASVSYSPGTGKWTWTGFDDLTFGFDVRPGDRITGAKWNYSRPGGTLTFKIQKKATGAGAWTDIVSATDVATVGVGSKTLACAEVVVTGTVYRLYIDASTNATTFDVSSYTIDRL